MISNSTPKKELGQHWLNHQKSLEEICNIANLSDDDVVLEVGPGQGSLTEMLAKRAKQIHAVELDKQLADSLPKRPNLKVYNQSILKFNLNDLPPNYKVVANIPYYLTSNLIRVLSESSNPPKDCTLLVQKEVAERIAAKAGDMSLLSVTTQMYFEPKLGLVIKAKLFEPPPKVDSQVIYLKRRAKPLFANKPKDKIFRIVKAGFANRRKTLLNSLSAGMMISKQEANKKLTLANIQYSQRPQELSLEDWLRLADQF